MENSNKIDDITSDVNKIQINKDSESNQFEEIAEKNKELTDDLCEKPALLNAGEDGPENILKDENELFD